VVLVGRTIAPVAIPELVVQEPLCDPVGTIISRAGQVPVVRGVGIARPGHVADGFVFGLLSDIAPVVGWLALAICLQVLAGAGEPSVGLIRFFLLIAG
jgi:hypothetical protein